MDLVLTNLASQGHRWTPAMGQKDTISAIVVSKATTLMGILEAARILSSCRGLWSDQRVTGSGKTRVSDYDRLIKNLLSQGIYSQSEIDGLLAIHDDMMKGEDGNMAYVYRNSRGNLPTTIQDLSIISQCENTGALAELSKKIKDNGPMSTTDLSRMLAPKKVSSETKTSSSRIVRGLYSPSNKEEDLKKYEKVHPQVAELLEKANKILADVGINKQYTIGSSADEFRQYFAEKSSESSKSSALKGFRSYCEKNIGKISSLADVEETTAGKKVMSKVTEAGVKNEAKAILNELLEKVQGEIRLNEKYNEEMAKGLAAANTAISAGEVTTSSNTDSLYTDNPFTPRASAA